MKTTLYIAVCPECYRAFPSGTEWDKYPPHVKTRFPLKDCGCSGSKVLFQERFQITTETQVVSADKMEDLRCDPG